MDTPTHPRSAAVTNRVARTVATLLAVTVGLMLLSTAPASAQATRPTDPTVAEAQFVQLLNQARSGKGLAPLQVHPNLVRDARAWSAVMAPQNRWVHTTTLGEETGRSLPNWRRAGENVGRGWEVQDLHNTFVNSPSHYANMMGDFDYVGIGVVYTSDRTYVTVRFAKVDAAVAGTSAPPRVNPAVASGQVRRLYLAFFKREPDAAGSNFWVSKISGGLPLGQISNEFIKSGEFRTTYGHLSDGQFITMVYQNVLGRAPDRAGYDYWVAKMAQGMSRGSVMTNFSESAEFKTKTA